MSSLLAKPVLVLDLLLLVNVCETTFGSRMRRSDTVALVGLSAVVLGDPFTL